MAQAQSDSSKISIIKRMQEDMHVQLQQQREAEKRRQASNAVVDTEIAAKEREVTVALVPFARLTDIQG